MTITVRVMSAELSATVTGAANHGTIRRLHRPEGRYASKLGDSMFPASHHGGWHSRPICRFRALMDLGRVQGISTTTAVAIVGALSSSRVPDIWTIAGLWLISVFAHSGGAAVNELWQRKGAALAPASKDSKGAADSGVIPPRTAGILAVAAIMTALGLSLAIFGPAAFLAILISCIWLVYFGAFGSRTVTAFDLAFAIGYPVYGLFGCLASGMPTLWIGVFMATVAGVALFSRWDHGREDLDTDRRFGVPSFAVVWGLSMRLGVRAKDPYYTVGLALKCVFMAVVALPLMYMKLPFTYFLMVFGIGYPAQVYVMWRFLKKQNRFEYLKTILIDVPLSWVLGSAIVIPVAGMLAYFAMKIFVVAGYLLGTALRSDAGTQFLRHAATAAAARA